MKDLIAKLQMDANCALGAIWMHIDVQEKRIAELEAQQAFGIGETYANALSRIAELEAQIAAASALVVEQKPVAEIVECDAYPDHAGRIEAFALLPIGTKLYAAPLLADTDKLRETFEAAWPEIHKAGMDHGWRGIAWASWKACAASTALQAPVREVPEPEPDMLWEAAEPEDGVTGNSPKDFAENYASAAVGRGETHDVDVLCATRSHKRTMRVSVSADEDAEDWLHWEWVDALPAAPVQQEGE